MSACAFLLDTPTELADQPAANEPLVSQHPVAKLGKYRDPRYGDFEITLEHFQSWKKNLHGPIQKGRVAIDYDHRAAGGSTEAAGWITDLTLDQEAGLVMASIEWTPTGAQAVRDRRWLYVSPEFTTLRDEQRNSHGNALVGTALTNRPFLRRGMPAISLSESVGDMPAATLIADAPARSDSQATMPLTKLNEALGLAADADEDATLAAVVALKQAPESDTDEPAKTLDEQAADAGKVLLDAGEVAQLQADATAGASAASELREMRFAGAFDKALSEGRIDAKPETRDRLHKLFEADEDTTLTLLSELAPVVKTTTVGSGGGDEIPAGVDADEFRLDQKAQAHAREHNVDYVTALAAVTQEG